MIFVIDVGNTNITMGVFDKDEIIAKFRLTTQINRTSDEYGLILTDLLNIKKVSIAAIDTAIISSVVPRVMYSLTSAIKKYLGVTPLNV